MAWALVIAAVVSLAAGGGVAYAADAAVPGDPLYGVDLAMEEVRLNLTNDSEAIFDYQLDRADERIGEAQKLAAAGDTGNMAQALAGYGEAFAGAAKQAGREDGNKASSGNARHTRLEAAANDLDNALLQLHNMGDANPAAAGVQQTDRDRINWCSDGTSAEPIVEAIATASGMLYGQNLLTDTAVLDAFCEGYSLGDILHAMAISGDAWESLLTDRRDAEGNIIAGWGQIMRDPDLNLIGPGTEPGPWREDSGEPMGPGQGGSEDKPEDTGSGSGPGTNPEDTGDGSGSGNRPENSGSGSDSGNKPADTGNADGAGNSGSGNTGNGGSGSSGSGGSGSGGSGNGPQSGIESSTVITPTIGEEAPGQGGGKGN